MKNNNLKEITVSLALVVLAIFIINPFNFWMPDMVHQMILGALVIVFGFFASLILRENVADERDGVHRMLAGRSAFLAGSITLIAGILYQSLEGVVDSWLVITLVVMVLSKITTRLYSDRNQ